MILGLPAHPLVVHGAVAGIPLASLAMLAYVLRPAWRSTLWWPAITTVVVAWAFSTLSGSTGETLEHALKESRFIEVHAEWANRLGIAMHALGASSLLALGVDRWTRSGRPAPPAAVRGLRTIALPATAIAAVACLVLVGVVGHLGAKAAWHDSPGASKSVRAER